MRVAVFRAADDGRRTAVRLAALGHEAVLAPVVRIVPTGVTVRVGDTDALVFTSARAPEALANHADGVTSICNLPCWCVGTRTADAARMAGFTRIRMGDGTAASLAAAIVAERSVARLAFMAGRDHKPELERALTQAGLRLTVLEAYEAQATPPWDAHTVGCLAGVEAVLHYSFRGAMLAARQASAAGLTQSFGSWAHFCLSADVATGLDRHVISTVWVAKQPDEAVLLTLLNRHPMSQADAV